MCCGGFESQIKYTVYIANPIYDVVFKYLMEDSQVAKLLIGKIIGKEVLELQPRPQEISVTIDAQSNIPLDVHRTFTVFSQTILHFLTTPFYNRSYPCSGIA